MSTHRRGFFGRLASIGAALWAGNKSPAQQHEQESHAAHGQQREAGGQLAGTESAGARGRTNQLAAQAQKRRAEYIPVETPDLPKLPYKMVDGVKEFHLIAEVVRSQFVPDRVVDAWGYNGSVPGPTIEVNEGDRVRVVFENHLPEPTAVHWHGFEVPMEMDGSVGLGQDPVSPGGRFVYEFALHQAGTFFYHSHMPMQEMMGMIGLFIMHPKEPFEPRVDRDFGIILQEWALLPNNTVPNTLSMEFNWLTLNGKSGPGCTPMLVKHGERVRIRLVNLGMDHHPMHLHGNTFVVTGTEAGRRPANGWFNQNTVLVGVAQARDIEFEAKYVGDWMLHCHLPHHMMNQMASMVGPVMSMGRGLQTGAGMEEGMGIVRQGNPLSAELGPAFGRGLGLSADVERLTSHLIGPQTAQTGTGAGVTPSIPGHDMSHMQAQAQGQIDPVTDMYPKDDPEKKKIPGYPQDMWMTMDHIFAKPENYGLRRGWSGALGGMMTIVRVLPPENYDQIMQMIQQKAAAPPKERTPAAHPLLGKVESVSESTGRLTVSHGKVEGWMGAMTMAYAIDKPETLKRVKAGDQIKATVYEGDYTLHDVEVLQPAKSGK